MTLSRDELIDAALELGSIAGVVADVCDHVEHNESADPADVRMAGQRLRALSAQLATCAGEPIEKLYGERLCAIEHRNVLHHPGALDGPDLLVGAKSWRDLQLVQVAHDRFYHPDVIGLTKADQLRHYALHLAKLAGAAAEAARGHTPLDDFVRRRVPDILLFGIKLATVTGDKLSDARFDATDDLLAFPAPEGRDRH
jgi:hypothetical protein